LKSVNSLAYGKPEHYARMQGQLNYCIVVIIFSYVA